jgi:phage terminase small subunit
MASARISDEFRTWVEDPANAGRQISDAPVYLDRMAVEIIIERRYFTE